MVAPSTFVKSRAAWVVALSLSLTLGLSAGCSSDDTPVDPDAITIGLLLPFTGSTSATASNFERAVLYAAGRINTAGGIQGRKLRVVSADTHSDMTRSIASADKLIAEGAVVVIGPESAEIAAGIVTELAAHDVALLSPLVAAANDQTVDCALPWFRLAPSARALGEAVAKLVNSEGLTSTAIVYSSGAYDEALSAAATTRFTTLGGTVPINLALEPNAQSYSAAVAQVQAAGAQSIILATSPRTAALFVNDFGAVGTNAPRWFLSPLLKTRLLLENTAPNALEGAVGVAPKIYDETVDFPDAFAKRWQGDQPLEGAYFYYDAMALLALALQKTTPDATGRLGGASLQAALRDAAGPPGEPVGWNELESGLSNLSNGSDIYYSGLTGPMLLNSCGSRQLGLTSNWKVHSGEIENY